MTHLRRQLVAIVLSFLFGVSSVQAGDMQGWAGLVVSGPAKADSRFLLWFDGHARFRDDSSELGTSIIRPAVGWRVSPDLDLWLGYARVTAHLDGPDISEDRIWQQATYPMGNILGGALSGRSRLEQRFRDSGDDTGYRFRQFVRWGKRFDGTDFSAVVWDELFLGVNTTNWGQRDGFDQNRLFLGTAWHTTQATRFELGYLHNRLGRPGDDQTNHNISLTFFVGL